MAAVSGASSPVLCRDCYGRISEPETVSTPRCAWRRSCGAPGQLYLEYWCATKAASASSGCRHSHEDVMREHCFRLNLTSDGDVRALKRFVFRDVVCVAGSATASVQAATGGCSEIFHIYIFLRCLVASSYNGIPLALQREQNHLRRKVCHSRQSNHSFHRRRRHGPRHLEGFGPRIRCGGRNCLWRQASRVLVRSFRRRKSHGPLQDVAAR